MMQSNFSLTAAPENMRRLFFQKLAQTSGAPVGLQIVKAKGIYQYSVDGKEYIDLISGFNVANIGHANTAVIEAAKKQLDDYMHLIVYGEFIQSPQVEYAKLLTEHLPENLNTVYFTNSGAEATEGALKLAKRFTGRPNIIAFNKAYHGSTQGALSVMGDEYWRNAYRPLLPGIFHFDYGSNEVIDAIDRNTACIILETVQAESGVTRPTKEWLQAIRNRCTETGTLLILDEIQAGFGRTGTLWAFEQFDIVPDILLLGKALGGGLPLGAFISSNEIMKSLTHDPVLGHITTFGGNPVCCAAGKAAFEFLLNEDLMQTIAEKQSIIQNKMKHRAIQSLNTSGLWASLLFESTELNQAIIHRCIEKGIITDWFIFAPDRLRIAPPLIITQQQLETSCDKILEAIEEVVRE